MALWDRAEVQRQFTQGEHLNAHIYKAISKYILDGVAWLHEGQDLAGTVGGGD